MKHTPLHPNDGGIPSLCHGLSHGHGPSRGDGPAHGSVLDSNLHAGHGYAICVADFSHGSGYGHGPLIALVC